jgi:ribosomal protein S18 acetylase RimI-like enzyme
MADFFNEHFRDFIQALNNRDVEYVLVGGMAVVLHGYVRGTGDMDIWVNKTKENYIALKKAFHAFGMPVFDMSEQNFLSNEFDVWSFGISPVKIEIMTAVKGLDFYETFRKAKYYDENDLKVRFIHFNDLIKAKQASGRYKDLDDIEQLTKNKTLSSVNIKYATADDAEFIADLSRRTFYETFAVHNTKENMDKFMNERFTKEALMKEVGEPENIFLLAYLENEPVGYVRLRDGEKPIELGDIDAIEIARIYTEQKTIGKGVGKALMLRCFEIAKEKKKKIIWLGVWEHNETAIAFYKKFGFEEFASHIFMLGEDVQTDFLMKKNL